MTHIDYAPVFASSLADLATLYTLDWEGLEDSDPRPAREETH
jgi:hypothetical protein